MNQHNTRSVLDGKVIRAGFRGDVLCVSLTGRFTARRLHAVLQRLRAALGNADYGALLVNAMCAEVEVEAGDLVALWQGPADCPLSARPCVIVHAKGDRELRALFGVLATRLAGGCPAYIIGAFPGDFLLDAADEALVLAAVYREEVVRREMRASSPVTSDKPARRPYRGKRPA
jgi:hypothetical protein